MFYIGGRSCVLCQFIEPVTFARCAFIFALRNIALGRYLDTRRSILEHLRHNLRPETYIYMYIHEFYIGGSTLLYQFIEPVTFAHLYLHCGISHWADI